MNFIDKVLERINEISADEFLQSMAEILNSAKKINCDEENVSDLFNKLEEEIYLNNDFDVFWKSVNDYIEKQKLLL